MKRCLFIVFLCCFFYLKSSAQVVTVSQTTNTGHWYSVNGYVGGQSFTLTQAGYLTEIRFNTLGAEGITTFEVREGQNVAGPLLYSTSINITAAGWFSVPLPNIPVCEGVYCFTQYYNDYGSLNVSNPYPGGMAYFAGSWSPMQDQEFEVLQIINEEPEVITVLPNQTLCVGETMPLINFTLADETPGSVSVSASSSNTSVVPNTNLILGGAGSARTISLSSPVTTPGTTTITISVSDGICTNQYTFNIQVNALPVVFAGADVAVCLGGSVTLAGSGAVIYTWTGGITNGVPFTPSPPGVYTYTVTGTDGNGCQNSDAASVTVHNLPVVGFSPVSDFCIDAIPYSLTEGTPAGGTYSGAGITGGVFSPGTAGLGAHAVTYTYVDGNGCLNSANQTIVVNNLPTVTLSGFGNVCLNDASFALSGGSPVGGIYSGLGVSAGNFNPGIAGVGTHTITYAYTDINGCAAVATNTITVLSLPSVSAGADASLCEGSSFILNGSGTAISYLWDGGITDGVTFTVVPGSTNYTVTGTDANGCTNTDVVTITGFNLPVVTFAPVADFCVDESPYVLTEGTPAGGTYSGTAISGGNTFSPSAAGIGGFTINYSYTDANGCTADNNQILTVNALPIVDFISPGDVCLNAAPFSMTGGSPAGGTYSGTGISAGIFDPSGAGLGTHTISYTFTDGATGCTNIDSDNILVYDAPVVTANATDTDICLNENVTLTGSGALTYLWDNGAIDGSAFTPALGTTIFTVTGTDANGCSNSDQVTITVHNLPFVSAGADLVSCEGGLVTLSGSGASTYIWNNGVTDGTAFIPPVGINSYVLTGTDLFGCMNTDTVEVDVTPLPVLTVSADQYFCVGDTIILTASGATTYDWNSGAGSGTSFEIIPTSTTSIQIAGTTSGCTTNDEIILTLDDPNNIDAGADQTICLGFITSLTATGGGSYLWSGPGINSTDETIGFIVDSSAYYIVEVTTANGCIYTDSVFVSGSEDPSCIIEPLTSFSPNGDAVNETWRIQGIEGFPMNRVTILNRWGDVVFEEDNYDNNNVLWDGTNKNGSEAPSGTYYFIIEITDGPSTTGWIQLMK